MGATARDQGINHQAGRDQTVINNTYYHVPPKPERPPGAPAADRSRHRVMLAGVAAVVVVIAGGFGIKAMLAGGHDQPGPTPGPTQSTRGEPAPAPTESSGEPSPEPPPTQPQDREKLLAARPFALRAPSEPNVIGVDLDTPKVKPPNEVTSSDDELQLSEISDGDWEFRTTTGISAGKTFEQCLQGVQGNALPSRIDAKDLRKQRTIRVGTVLCTETSEGNLAMLEVTSITPSADSDLPDVQTKLTVWENA
ncbi:hypothetical protein C3486_20970 [Streptomyces sp. Ru73]|uniref:hypothetical protein n=1 Tax=Streptomyces sp. Ru73 TaxID=2080748 RepID=UPI000CDD923E|nr:hypothetical protein [Streptomyces sp. Ru73]POX38847.1 hypothetical protein C3486_20970 [Streptomyces sp. Ru73]